jgi:hypothetical protein
LGAVWSKKSIHSNFLLKFWVNFNHVQVKTRSEVYCVVKSLQPCTLHHPIKGSLTSVTTSTTTTNQLVPSSVQPTPSQIVDYSTLFDCSPSESWQCLTAAIMESAHSTPTLTPPPQEVANLPISGIYKVVPATLIFILDTNVNPGELFKYTCGRNDSR